MEFTAPQGRASSGGLLHARRRSVWEISGAGIPVLGPRGVGSRPMSVMEHTDRFTEGNYDGVLRVMDREQGDYKVMWDKDKPDEILEARHTFERLKAKGYLAYTVSEDGSRGETITEFDPEAGRTILAPP